jgi:hypothetical protein
MKGEGKIKQSKGQALFNGLANPPEFFFVSLFQR